jgi:hypothetical protein
MATETPQKQTNTSQNYQMRALELMAAESSAEETSKNN